MEVNTIGTVAYYSGRRGGGPGPASPRPGVPDRPGAATPAPLDPGAEAPAHLTDRGGSLRYGAS